MSEFDTVDYENDINAEESLKDKYLTFQVEDEYFGVEIRYVIEIIGIQKITNLPDMPSFIKGVINLRGKVIPVLDIRSRFAMEEIPYGERTCIIVVKIDGGEFGFIVDTVKEVVDMPSKIIDKPPRGGYSQKSKYISGIGKHEENVIIVIDINKVLTEKELQVMQNSK